MTTKKPKKNIITITAIASVRVPVKLEFEAEDFEIEKAKASAEQYAQDLVEDCWFEHAHNGDSDGFPDIESVKLNGKELL